MDTKRLKELYDNNHTYQEIADNLGVKRSSVDTMISRLRRYGEISKFRIKPTKKGEYKPRGYNGINSGMIVMKAANHALKDIEWNYPPTDKSVSLIDLQPMQCHWPMNGGLYCGCDALKSHGYCEEHFKKMRGKE